MNKPEKHDGVSPIIVPACKNGIEYEEQFQYLGTILFQNQEEHKPHREK